MSTSKDYHDYVFDCLSQAAEIKTRKMMGEYCIYYCGKVIGLICDNTLFLKSTPTTELFLENCDKAYPYEGSKTLMHVVEDFENTELMKPVLEALGNELPDKK